MIYAEWKKDGNFNNGFFDTWEAWYEFSFSPEMEILKVKEVN